MVACLPELDQVEQQQQSNNIIARLSPQDTPSPPPPAMGTTSTTTPIYARVNPNHKRDAAINRTNNNNFTSTFAPIVSSSGDLQQTSVTGRMGKRIS
jgi:hypothetical protein